MKSSKNAESNIKRKKKEGGELLLYACWIFYAYYKKLFIKTKQVFQPIKQHIKSWIY